MLPLKTESSLGIEVYLTSTPPLGGILRKEIDDFVVEEIPVDFPLYPSPPDNNPHTVLKVRARNWETNRLVEAISRIMKLGERRITFCGTKDRRAVSVQYICIKGVLDENRIKRLDFLKDVHVDEWGYTNRKLAMGDLIGNRFDITVRDIERDEAEARDIVSTALSEMDTHSGAPNFFGLQRFGVVRPVTHIVGRAIVKGDLETAVMTYIGHPFEWEPDEIKSARKRVEEKKDFTDALEYYPSSLGFERRIIEHLARNPDDYRGALLSLPYNLLLMFVHAYQSYIFNRILSLRLKNGLPLNRPVIGDLAVGVDRYNLPHHKRWHRVNEKNINRVDMLCRRGYAYITSLVPGYSVELADGEMGEIEARILEEERVDMEEFKLPHLPQIASAGIRRENSSPIHEAEFQVSGNTVRLRFWLNKGCYATSVLREIIKSGDSLTY